MCTSSNMPDFGSLGSHPPPSCPPFEGALYIIGLHAIYLDWICICMFSAVASIMGRYMSLFRLCPDAQLCMAPANCQ